MKRADDFLTNTTTPAGRTFGAAKNNPGDNSGSGMDKEIYNDPAYACFAVINSYKEAGISSTDETLTDSDFRDAIEEITERTVSSVDVWDGVTIFGVGDLVTYKGYQFVSYVAANQNNIPFTNPDKWFKCPKSDKLLDMYFSAEPIKGGMNDIADRAGGSYQQNLLIGKYRLGGKGDTFYNFYRVALDGTTVTGNATLEAIFKPGLAGEYFKIDLFAPDELGTRTLLDAGDYIPTPQSSGGDADTLGELVEDQMQSLYSRVFADSGTGTIWFDLVASNSWDSDRQTTGGVPIGSTSSSKSFGSAVSTLSDGSTTHGKRFTEGASYIIVMVAA